MKKTGILIGLIMIVISASYILFATKNEKESNYFKPVNEISDKREIEKSEYEKPSPSVKNNKPSPVPETKPDIPDLKDKPEPVSTLLDPGKDDTARNEAANFLRDAGYKGLTDDLITVLNNPNEKARFRSFAVQHLYNNYAGAGEKEKQKIREVLYKTLNDRHVEVQREALLTLVRIGDPKGKETAAAWLIDEDKDNVRDLAIRCVKLLELKEHIPAIRKYLYDNTRILYDDALKCREKLISFYIMRDSRLNRVGCNIQLSERLALPARLSEEKVAFSATSTKYNAAGRSKIRSGSAFFVQNSGTDEVIRIAAVVALSQWEDEQSRPAFEKAAESQSVRLQRAGKAALKRLEEKNRL